MKSTNKPPMPDVTLMGIDQETYNRYHELARKQGKPVVEVISAALRKGLEPEVTEQHSEKQLLCEAGA